MANSSSLLAAEADLLADLRKKKAEDAAAPLYSPERKRLSLEIWEIEDRLGGSIRARELLNAHLFDAAQGRSVAPNLGTTADYGLGFLPHDSNAIPWDDIAAQVNAEAAAANASFRVPPQPSTSGTSGGRAPLVKTKAALPAFEESNGAKAWAEIADQLNAEARAANPRFRT